MHACMLEMVIRRDVIEDARRLKSWASLAMDARSPQSWAWLLHV